VSGSAFAVALLLAGPAVCQEVTSPLPYRKAGQQPLDFRGPGREDPEPDVPEVALGWFGPSDPDDPGLGEPWRGATLALEQENAAGGYHGKPLRLLPVWSEKPWQAAITDLTRLVYERGLWAILGGVDGATTHLAVQTALKSRILLLTPGSSDTTTDAANVPWLFSLPPSDEAQVLVILGALAKASRGGPYAIAAATDHDSHAALAVVRRVLREGRLAPTVIVDFAARDADLPALARQLVEGPPGAILVLAPAPLAGRLVAAIRTVGFSGPILGGMALATNAFRRAAGRAAEDVRAPFPAQIGPGWRPFAVSYEGRWGEAPDQAAAHAYDAVRLVTAAVRRAGLNRARIRDEVRAIAPWTGAASVVRWNNQGRNESTLVMGSWTQSVATGGAAVPVWTSPRR
jgi:ABC-type branched-subunit amino acid transport system substrate-binding protein